MSDELTGGRWVRDGLIQRWTGPRPVDVISDYVPEACDDCGRQLVSQRSWSNWRPERRRERAETHAKKASDGLCHGCWMRTKRGGGRRSVAKCGTYAGYAAHLRAEEPICDPCRTAMREYKRELAARKKAS